MSRIENKRGEDRLPNTPVVLGKLALKAAWRRLSQNDLRSVWSKLDPRWATAAIVEEEHPEVSKVANYYNYLQRLSEKGATLDVKKMAREIMETAGKQELGKWSNYRLLGKTRHGYPVWIYVDGSEATLPRSEDKIYFIGHYVGDENALPWSTVEPMMMPKRQ